MGTRAAPQRIGILGLGVAGRAMARALAHAGVQLVLADDSPARTSGLPQFHGHRVVQGDVPHDIFVGCHTVMASPGVPPGHQALAIARAHGIPVVGEVEFIARLEPRAKTLAITGTNGKSTTTSLAGALCRGLQLPAFVGGNLGDAIGDWLAESCDKRPRAAILELSSYQIDGLVDYRPEVAVMLNVTPDHLARYGSFERYLHSKGRLINALPKTGTAVLNADDARVRAMALLTSARLLWFTAKPELPKDLGPAASGMVLQNNHAVPVGAVGQIVRPVPLDHPTLIGEHNLHNALAALLGVTAFVRHVADDTQAEATATSRALRAAYLAYGGLPHRLAPVAVVDGVRYLNDSKATNDASAATAVRAMQAPYLLLVGGQDKGGGYLELASALLQRPPKTIIAFGAARALLLAALQGTAPKMHETVSLEDACALAQSLAAPGDTVLLSPACTSFDAFDNYQHRGETFAAWVQAQRGAR